MRSPFQNTSSGPATATGMVLVAMSKLVASLLASKTEKQKAADKARAVEKAKKKEICRRQATLEKEEVTMDWRMVFGSIAPKKKKDTFLLKNITRRNVWMETDYLYNQIKGFKPDELFHPVGKYALQWQPRGSQFRLVIPLDNPQVQENAVVIMSKFSKWERERVLFYFSPIDPGMDMYAPRVHPSSLVSYHTKNEVLKKLCDFFLLDKISVQEIQAVLMCDQYVWSAMLYNLLPEDEQVYHRYLNEQKPLDDTRKTLAKSYIDGDITLQDYEDAKFPDRKKQRDIEGRTYPLPFDKDTCSICTKEDAGIVKCHTCKNMVCASCMGSIFSGKNGRKSISFLLMHQKFCMKLGELATIQPLVDDEPAYLREFRSTTRAAALELLLPKKDADLMKEDHVSEDEEEAEERRRQELEEQRLAAEEAARLLRDNPVPLQAIREQFDARYRKFERIARDITDYTEKVLDKTHTDQFIARNTRLRAEAIERLNASVVSPVRALDADARALNLTGEFIMTLLNEIADVLDKCELMSVDDPADAVLITKTTSRSAAATPASPTSTRRRQPSAPSASSRGASPSTPSARKRPVS
jgi:hypothetical protein